MTATVLSGPFRPQKRVNAMPSEVLGMLIFVLTEVMFFMALVSGFLVIRSQVFAAWAPPGQLKLPVMLTAFNTVVLLVSGVTMALAMRAFAREDGRERARALFAQTIAFGAFFVLVQGYEWVRLIRYGMTMTSGIFGATFFLLIGSHGLHALIAVLAMGRLFLRMRAGKATLNGFRAMGIFWFFIVGIWPVLYSLVYFG